MSRMSNTTEEKKSGLEQKVDKFYHKAVGMFTHSTDNENLQEENIPSVSVQSNEKVQTEQEMQLVEETMNIEEIFDEAVVIEDVNIKSDILNSKQTSKKEEQTDKLDNTDELNDMDELDSLLDQKEKELAFDQSADKSEVEKNPVTFTLFFSADKMNAYIRAQDYRRGKDVDNRISTDVIYELLKEKDVTYGIDEAGIVEYCKGDAFYKDFQVATGLRPVKGEDGSIEYFFSMDLRSSPTENDDGTVNYKELGLVRNVNAGDVLCRITPQTDGIEGIDVFGKPVKATPGKPAVINSGKGVEVSEDGLEFIAINNGMVEINKGAVEIKEVYTISGDVGPATGNIRFNGAVVVMGSVLSDYAIYANGDIVVNGYVEASILNSTGDIVIKNGINGMKKGFLKADGDVTVKFAEMARIVAGQNFYCDYCINCDVRAVESIIGKGKRASLLGGNYIAGKTIEVNTIGSDLNIPMDVQIIPNWQDIRNLKTKPEERIRENQEIMSQYEDAFSKLKHSYDLLDGEITRASRKNSMDTEEEIKAKKKKVLMLMQKKTDIRREMIELQEKKDKLNADGSCEGCMVIARKVIHTSVRVIIGTAMFRINGHMDHQTFIEDNGTIESHNVTPGSV
ncbi:DUF342 domain-containing protein [Aminipila sp.]|uniref:DUF342 domain-containing protein n=1 Tax=Aminipila sp. TaxID=2060095 RepID=UPI0028A10239|nr:FapA family protein [Aminipila sp.]